jgi:outer membrane protein assembly factor BamB
VFACVLTVSLITACGGGSGSQQGVAPVPGQPENLEPNAVVTGSAAIDWTTWGFDRQRTGYNPAEMSLSNSNVANLKFKWSFPYAGTIANTQPLVASHVKLANGTLAQIVYVGDENSDFYAVGATNGKLMWSRKLAKGTACDNKSTGITDTPVIDRLSNRIYMIDGVGQFHALDISTGVNAAGFTTTQVYPQTTYRSWTGLLLSPDASTVYFGVASHCDIGKYYGSIDSINTTTRALTTFQLVTNMSTYYANGSWSWGGATMDPATGNVYNSVGNSQGSLGEAGQYSDSIIELTSSLGFVADEQPDTVLANNPDWDIGTTPVIYNDQGSCIAFQRKDGHFFTVDRTHLSNGNVGSNLSLGGTLGTPAYYPATHALYVNVPAGLTKLNVGPNCTATIAWQTPIGSYGFQVPIVANGVVYAAGGSKLYAVDAVSGAVLWNSGTTITNTIAATPTVANGQLYASSWDGHLYAFSL